MNLDIKFISFSNLHLVIFSDVDWINDKFNCKFITDTVIKIAESLIFWQSTKQINVILSIIKVKYIAVFETVKKLITIHEIFMKLEILLDDYKFSILMNNNRTIAAFNNEKVIHNTCHIDIRYHHIWNLVAKEIIDILYMSSFKMIVNNFIKSLSTDFFIHFVKKLRLTH